jgi:hypothetical protein
VFWILFGVPALYISLYNYDYDSTEKRKRIEVVTLISHSILLVALLVVLTRSHRLLDCAGSDSAAQELCADARTVTLNLIIMGVLTGLLALKEVVSLDCTYHLLFSSIK